MPPAPHLLVCKHVRERLLPDAQQRRRRLECAAARRAGAVVGDRLDIDIPQPQHAGQQREERGLVVWRYSDVGQRGADLGKLPRVVDAGDRLRARVRGRGAGAGVSEDCSALQC